VAPATPASSGTGGSIDDGMAARTLTLRDRYLTMRRTKGMISILQVKENSQTFFGVKWHGSCDDKVMRKIL
jgi:hypothetical protein